MAPSDPSTTPRPASRSFLSGLFKPVSGLKTPNLRKTGAYRLGFLEGHDAGYNRAAVQYMDLIRRLLGEVELEDIS